MCRSSLNVGTCVTLLSKAFCLLIRQVTDTLDSTRDILKVPTPPYVLHVSDDDPDLLYNYVWEELRDVWAWLFTSMDMLESQLRFGTATCRKVWLLVGRCGYYGKVWLLVGRCGYLWEGVVTMGRCGYLWEGVVTCGKVWLLVGRCGYLWEGVVTCGNVVTCGKVWLLWEAEVSVLYLKSFSVLYLKPLSLFSI